ncbi:SlyB Outer membrane lipoprotein [Comamonadaceae bacterium]
MKSANSLIAKIALFAAVLCAPAFSWAQNVNLSTVFESDNRQASTYRRNDGMVEGTAEICKVVRARTVRLEAGNTAKAVATGAGAILGGAIGSRSGSNNYGISPEAALGGIIGAVGLNNIVNHMASTEGQEFFLNCNGAARTIVQESDGEPLPERGAEVFLQRVGGRTRVVI